MPSRQMIVTEPVPGIEVADAREPLARLFRDLRTTEQGLTTGKRTAGWWCPDRTS